MKQLQSPFCSRQGQWEAVPRVTDIRMTHFPCLFPLFPFNNPRTSFSLTLHSGCGTFCLLTLCEGWISACCSFPKGCTLMAAGLAASSAPSRQPGAEPLDTAWYPGADQTMGQIKTLCMSLGIAPCLLQPQTDRSQSVTDCPSSEGTLQTHEPALQ